MDLNKEINTLIFVGFDEPESDTAIRYIMDASGVMKDGIFFYPEGTGIPKIIQHSFIKDPSRPSGYRTENSVCLGSSELDTEYRMKLERMSKMSVEVITGCEHVKLDDLNQVEMIEWLSTGKFRKMEAEKEKEVNLLDQLLGMDDDLEPEPVRDPEPDPEPVRDPEPDPEPATGGSAVASAPNVMDILSDQLSTDQSDTADTDENGTDESPGWSFDTFLDDSPEETPEPAESRHRAPEPVREPVREPEPVQPEPVQPERREPEPVREPERREPESMGGHAAESRHRAPEPVREPEPVQPERREPEPVQPERREPEPVREPERREPERREPERREPVREPERREPVREPVREPEPQFIPEMTAEDLIGSIQIPEQEVVSLNPEREAESMTSFPEEHIDSGDISQIDRGYVDDLEDVDVEQVDISDDHFRKQAGRDPSRSEETLDSRVDGDEDMSLLKGLEDDRKKARKRKLEQLREERRKAPRKTEAEYRKEEIERGNKRVDVAGERLSRETDAIMEERYDSRGNVITYRDRLPEEDRKRQETMENALARFGPNDDGGRFLSKGAGRITLVAAGKGGVGKTLVTVGLADSLALARAKAREKSPTAKKNRVWLIESDYLSPKLKDAYKTGDRHLGHVADVMEEAGGRQINSERARQAIEDSVFVDEETGVNILACPALSIRGAKSTIPTAIIMAVKYASESGGDVFIDHGQLTIGDYSELDYVMSIELAHRIVIVSNMGCIPQTQSTLSVLCQSDPSSKVSVKNPSAVSVVLNMARQEQYYVAQDKLRPYKIIGVLPPIEALKAENSMTGSTYFCDAPMDVKRDVISRCGTMLPSIGYSQMDKFFQSSPKKVPTRRGKKGFLSKIIDKF